MEDQGGPGNSLEDQGKRLLAASVSVLLGTSFPKGGEDGRWEPNCTHASGHHGLVKDTLEFSTKGGFAPHPGDTWQGLQTCWHEGRGDDAGI